MKDLKPSFNEYVYYSLRRPVSIGTHPKKGLVSFNNFDERKYIDEIEHEAWGKLFYDRELTQDEIDEYELKGKSRWIT